MDKKQSSEEHGRNQRPMDTPSGLEVVSHQETRRFWASWFAGFSEIDFEVTRTIAAEEVVVMQWVFTGTQTGPLEPPVFGRRVEPTGRTVQFRGVSVYDVREGLIQREKTIHRPCHGHG